MNKMFRNAFAFMLAAVMIFGVVPFGAVNLAAKASALDASGKCGENVSYTFNAEKGILTVSGTGAMTDYSYGGSPFYGNSDIKAVIIKSGVTGVGTCAFKECGKMTSLFISKTVAEIGGAAFYACNALEEIDVDENNTVFDSRNGCNAIIETENDKLILGCSTTVIPDGVKSIGDSAFYFCKELTDLIIPDSVTAIGKFAFAFCTGLLTVKLPNTVETIGENAFERVNNLLISESSAADTEGSPWGAKSLNGFVENGIVYNDSGKTAILGCSSAKSGNVTVADSVTRIGDYAFYGCSKIKKLIIPDSVSAFGEGAFDGCDSMEVCCNKNSKARRYCEANGISYVLIDNVSAPLIIASNVASSGKIKLTWDAVSGAEKYMVYRSSTLLGVYKLMKTTTDTSYVNTTASAGEKYYYKVKSVSADGTLSRYSKTVSRTCDLPKPEITQVSNIASTGKIKLDWDAVDGATSYRVYRAESKNGTYTLMKTTAETTYDNISTVGGKTYYYKIKAICDNSEADSAFSNIKTRTCDLARPTAKIKINSDGKPVVSWKAVEGATAYRVYRSTTFNGTYKLMKTVTDGTSYTNTSITRGKAYYYKVKAVCSNSAADSAYSAVVSEYV